MGQHRPLKVGDEISVWWFTDKPNNMASVLKILPYKGMDTQFFDCVLLLSAPRTYRGSLEMAANLADAARDRDWDHEILKQQTKERKRISTKE